MTKWPNCARMLARLEDLIKDSDELSPSLRAQAVPAKGRERMADEEQTHQDSGWLDKLQDPESVRSYRPVRGPAEPSQPPPGRGSASTQPGDTAQIGDDGTGHSASTSDQDG